MNGQQLTPAENQAVGAQAAALPGTPDNEVAGAALPADPAPQRVGGVPGRPGRERPVPHPGRREAGQNDAVRLAKYQAQIATEASCRLRIVEQQLHVAEDALYETLRRLGVAVRAPADPFCLGQSNGRRMPA